MLCVNGLVNACNVTYSLLTMLVDRSIQKQLRQLLSHNRFKWLLMAIRMMSGPISPSIKNKIQEKFLSIKHKNPYSVTKRFLIECIEINLNSQENELWVGWANENAQQLRSDLLKRISKNTTYHNSKLIPDETLLMANRGNPKFKKRPPKKHLGKELINYIQNTEYWQKNIYRLKKQKEIKDDTITE